MSYLSFLTNTHTCVLVKCKEVGASSRHCAICHFAIFFCVRVMGWYSDDGGSWSTLRAQTDCIVYRVKHGPVIINVQQCHIHIGSSAQATLRNRKMEDVLFPTECGVPECGCILLPFYLMSSWMLFLAAEKVLYWTLNLIASLGELIWSDSKNTHLYQSTESIRYREKNKK